MGRKQILVAGIVAFVVIVWLIVCAILVNPGAELLPTYALAELWVSALAFLVVWLTLILITFQFRKAMAKPELKVIFSENGKQEISIDIYKDKIIKQYLKLSVVNKGNAITDLFQIDFDIPDRFNPTINSNTVNSVHHRANGNNRIVSFINKHEYVCFVNIPTPIPSLVLEIHKSEYDKYSRHLVIPYKIYGDWAETQEGKLKVNINKQ